MPLATADGGRVDAAVKEHRVQALLAGVPLVATDVGGLFIGKAMGHRPISAASPNKTLEGTVGGMGVALVTVLVLVGVVAVVGLREGRPLVIPAIVVGAIFAASA